MVEIFYVEKQSFTGALQSSELFVTFLKKPVKLIGKHLNLFSLVKYRLQV